ncbi:MAG: HPr(Ser) kinase/phosphatase [Candidatus Binatia bacterium]|nr:HPr(Ser) kinase/phosphatase [Candidatus Binatia bacterium]
MNITVREVVGLRGSLKFKLASGGRGLNREISAPRVQKPALALAGYLDQIHPGRIQVLGNAEIGYLRRLSKDEAAEAVDGVCRSPVACLVVTNGNTIPEMLRKACSRHRVPLLVTDQRTNETIRGLTRWLEERLSPETTIHGVLLRVIGHGVLLLGKSGIGKSEAALALLNRGHLLVADDVVHVREAPQGALKGRCADGLRHHLEIRGLGVLDVEQLFGTLATLDETAIDVAIELVDATLAEEEPDRLGIEDRHITLLGIDLPHLQIQLRAGRDVATLIEVAARSQQLKARGIHSAKRFVSQSDRNLRRTAARGRG